MTTVKSCSEPEWKDVFIKYMKSASTRQKACSLVAAEYGYSEGYIKKKASEMGLLSSSHSLRFIFSEEEEQMLVLICIVYARQGSPLTIDAFRDLASFLAGRDEMHPISRHFVDKFIERHKEELWARIGKLTSPKRCLSTMLPLTNKFISDYERLLAEKKICESNVFVFDETIIGHKGTLPLVIAERRDSGGGTANVFRKREGALGCYIPFSTLDGNTPFRAFVINEKTCKQLMTAELPMVPAAEKGLRETPHRVFYSSKTGYMSIDQFRPIMEDFINWWTTTHEGVDCLLISDNLSVHKNQAVVDMAREKGVHMLNIMPGSSHWFQVHDQKPFAILKKKLIASFYDVFSDTGTDHEANLEVRMAKLYEAESTALKREVLQSSIKEVGLRPWNPDLIRENCRKHSPPDVNSDPKDLVDEFAQKVSTYTLRQQDKIQLVRSKVKHVSAPVTPKPEKRKRSTKVFHPAQAEVNQEEQYYSDEENMTTSTEPPRKKSKKVASGAQSMCCKRVPRNPFLVELGCKD